MSRAVLVDDTDPRIQYEGSGWSMVAGGATDSWGIFGTTYNETLHETETSGSLSFKFNGTGFGFFGTIDTTNNRTAPSWSCTLDGKVSEPGTVAANVQTNRFPLCEQNAPGAIEHTATLNVSVPQGAIFWFDMASFGPREAVLGGETVIVQDTDSDITYEPSANWQRNGAGLITDIPNSYLTYVFSGTSLTFYSVIPPNLTSSTGSYAVDGGDPIDFDIPGHVSLNPRFNEPMFSITDLSPEPHSLRVTYTGNRNDTPLFLDHFFVTLPPKPETPSTSSSATEPPPSAQPSREPAGDSGATPVGAIVGGVVGGVVVLALLVFVALFLRRRRVQQDLSRSEKPTPFISPENQSLMSPTTPFNPYSTSSVAGETEVSAVSKQRLAMESFHQPRSVDVVHVDSGLRIGEPSNGPVRIRDIPPHYTEQ